MADIEKLQAELQMLRAENAQLKDELKKIDSAHNGKECVSDAE